MPEDLIFCIHDLEEKKHDVIKRKRKQYKLPLPVFNKSNLIKLTTFLASEILTYAFPNTLHK